MGRGLYYRKLTIEVCEDVDGGIDLFLREDTDNRSKTSGVVDIEDYKNIMTLIHKFDQEFREMEGQRYETLEN